MCRVDFSSASFPVLAISALSCCNVDKNCYWGQTELCHVASVDTVQLLRADSTNIGYGGALVSNHEAASRHQNVPNDIS